jgi:hypothetical protein
MMDHVGWTTQESPGDCIFMAYGVIFKHLEVDKTT